MSELTEIAFTKTKLPFGWMGNMSPYPVVDENGIQWRTTEALFQAMRFAEDDPIREEIRKEKSPMGAKLKAKANVDKMVVEQLSEQDLENMRYCVRLKLEQHKDLADMLRDSKELPIYEDVTNRGRKGSNLFWGALRLDEDTWEGENWLGNIWMEMRDELQGKPKLEKGVEIERRFLLKRVPHIQFDDAIMITQHYISDRNSNKVERIRCSQRDQQNPTMRYTSKERISEMAVHEHERDLSSEEYRELKKKSNRSVTKVRWVKKEGDLKWEIDEMISFTLIVAEIEIPSEDYDLEIPDYIKNNLIMEITGMNQFSNSNLAE